MTPVADLPLIDEHETVVAASVGDVWPAVLGALDDGFSGPVGRAVATAVGCEPRTRSGPRPLTDASSMPGFRVTSIVPERELVLEGRHRFSTYALTFRLEPIDARRTRVRAESRAVFPGVHGRAYRLLVIGTRGHVVAVRRLLAGIRRGAEGRTTAPS